MKIKNWQEFQHFKDRTPPWIKLYKNLLNDREWFKLSGDDAKILVMLWLIASEDKDMLGNLPSVDDIAFRLRIEVSKLKQSLKKLSHWVEQDDINLISERYQDDAPETETETETEERQRQTYAQDFETFWLNYPKKKSKADALKAWKKNKPRLDDVLYALGWQKATLDWIKDQGKYIPYPASYLNAQRWLDEEPTGEPF